MISHEYKCIFIHISKCAGSTVERSFGIDTTNNSSENNSNLFGWCSKNKFYLQHATPEKLLDLNYITAEQWNSYYKFIIVRNPWSRALSDYLWISNNYNIKDSFTHFIKKKGKYVRILTKSKGPSYRGDHLYKQKPYFFIHGEEIKYDKVIRLENFNNDIKDLDIDNNLIKNMLDSRSNVGKNKLSHYSVFYNNRRKKLIEREYSEDIYYLGYEFKEEKSLIQKLKSNASSKSFLK